MVAVARWFVGGVALLATQRWRPQPTNYGHGALRATHSHARKALTR